MSCQRRAISAFFLHASHQVLTSPSFQQAPQKQQALAYRPVLRSRTFEGGGGASRRKGNGAASPFLSIDLIEVATSETGLVSIVQRGEAEARTGLGSNSNSPLCVHSSLVSADSLCSAQASNVARMRRGDMTTMLDSRGVGALGRRLGRVSGRIEDKRQPEVDMAPDLQIDQDSIQAGTGSEQKSVGLALAPAPGDKPEREETRGEVTPAGTTPPPPSPLGGRCFQWMGCRLGQWRRQKS